MSVIDKKQKKQLKELFEKVQRDVNVLLFTQEFECRHCKTTREMLEEVSELSERIKLEVLDFVNDASEAEKYGIDRIPAIVIKDDKDYGIRFFGVPAGYEFTTLIEDILMVAKGDPGLSKDALEEAAQINEKVNLEVFISPTCPVCPNMVKAAHKLAMASDNVTAAMVEATEFPHLIQKYDVQGVPHTMITEEYGFVGEVDVKQLATEILVALGKKPAEESEFLQEHEHHQHEQEA
ncbi:MAG: thioredoxin family protein [bacterium]